MGHASATANVGLSPDEHFCFLETDDEDALREKCADLPADIWNTMRVSARENRCYFVFRQTMRTRKAGNMTVTREGQQNLFEFKQHRLYVVGPGSIHEKTGKPYEVQECTIPAMPDVLLKRLCELYGAPDASASAAMSESVRLETDKLDRFLEHYEVAILGDWFNNRKQWFRPIVCPWESEHENSNQGTSTCIVYTDGGGYGFDCKHRCSSKGWKEFRAEMEFRFPDKTFFFVNVETILTTAGSTAPPTLTKAQLTHADIAKVFLASDWGKNFYRVYDLPGKPVASWATTRWVISTDTELLRSSVRDYLNQLYDSLPTPAKGADPRAKLKSAPFCRDVTAEALIKLETIKAEAFDRNEYLLGLPAGCVVELRTGTIRAMRRDDFVSRRMYLTPDATVQTTRWDSFLDEITLGNVELKVFILRVCSLCLTAHAFHGLFFFWGKGRNGKGALLRILSHILGDVFADTFRPRELTKTKDGSDGSQKRSLSKLEGRRLMTADEAVGTNLDLSLLKTISGGGKLSAARMRENDRQFQQTHKLILPTNDKPELPNDPAFQGRTYFVPFLADFRDVTKQDPELDAKLQSEAPGILAHLIAICPEVIANGLQAPKTVTDATAELLEENDLVSQFRDDMLFDAPGKNISFDAMERAVDSWLTGYSGNLVADYHRNGRDSQKVLAGLKMTYLYKRLRPEGKAGRQVYHFLSVGLRVEGS